MKKVNLVILFVLLSLILLGQHKKTDSSTVERRKLNYKALIIPVALITYGVVGLESHTLKQLNSSTNRELIEHIDKKISIDDFSQYGPFVSVYILNAAGIKGKHNLKDRTIILGTAYLIMGTTVNCIKLTGNEERPDKTSFNSFPSGHTATAFMGAEFLYQEYKGLSAWYGISGYLAAAATGFFRMHNGRHWLSDIAAGAGIGILSTKVAYWLHPYIKRKIFKDKKDLSGTIMPFYNTGQYGLGMVVNF